MIFSEISWANSNHETSDSWPFNDWEFENEIKAIGSPGKYTYTDPQDSLYIVPLGMYDFWLRNAKKKNKKSPVHPKWERNGRNL